MATLLENEVSSLNEKKKLELRIQLLDVKPSLYRTIQISAFS